MKKMMLRIMRCVLRLLFPAVLAAFVVPLICWMGWYGLTAWDITVQRNTGNWPCRVAGETWRREAGRALYSLCYVSTAPGRYLVLASRREDPQDLFDSLVERDKPDTAYSAVRMPPLSAVLSGKGGNFRAFAAYYCAYTLPFWIIVLAVLEGIRWYFFRPGLDVLRKVLGWWAIGAAVGVVTAAIVITRMVMGHSCGPWNWPLLVVAVGVIVWQVRMVQKGRALEGGRVQDILPVAFFPRLHVATWLLATVNAVIWAMVTPL